MAWIDVDGKLVEVGEKIPFDLQADRIEIINDDNDNDDDDNDKNRNNNSITAVVLNKPLGFVSGQAEHGHPPAIRLLSPRNRILIPGEENDNGLLRKGFAPAGRLDMDSTGLLVFTKNGVLAKKLIGSSSCVEKEYIVHVERAKHVTKREYDLNPNFILPSSSSEQCFDLTRIMLGGETLLGDFRPLKPCTCIRWILKGKILQIILTEGKKHHIRRMCRELLGFHVVKLQRIRIGPIKLLSSSKTKEEEKNVIPEGCWRQLRHKEIESLLATSNYR